MAAAIFHVLDAKAPYGTYDCTGSGAVKSWADIARAVFEAANGNGERVVPVSTADYYANASNPIAPRPVHSALNLSRLESVGFHMPTGRKSWRSTSRHSSLYLICESKSRRLLTAAFLMCGV